MIRRTPESAGAERAFVDKAMALIRLKLYPSIKYTVFEREYRDLLLAVSEPAAYFKLRGWNGSAGLYLKILSAVLDALLEKSVGILKSRNRATVLRHWLQKELKFRGDTYLEDVKAAETKATAAIASAVLKGLKVAAPDQEARVVTETLVAARNLLAPPPRAKRL